MKTGKSRTTKKRTPPRKRAAAKSSTREQLAEYRRKRDFQKTAEPAGAEAAAHATSQLQFVIQKHAASHLHYDLRLELDGVMKSWAVPKGPSLDPSVKRLAMGVEDHPMEYNTFEGTIPKGEYGGGTVMLWDRGTYAPDEIEPGETPEDAVRRGLRAGKLAFTFHGERLQGSFALVRTHRHPRPKWLLFKHRDDEATTSYDITDAARTSVVTGRTMEEIAGEADRVWRSNRGGQKGGEERVAVAVEPDAGVTPMRPQPARALPEGDDWTFEPWYGGERVLAYAASDGARLIDTRGRDVTRRHAALAAEIATLAERAGRRFVVEAELTGAGDQAELHVSDLLVDDEPLLNEPWRVRRAALDALLARRRLQRVHRQPTRTAGPALLRRAQREGWAGVLARHLDAPYVPGAQNESLLRVPTR